jgi:hypothetical protein
MQIRRNEEALEALLRKMEELGKLPENWDSYGAQPLSTEVVLEAQEKLRRAYLWFKEQGWCFVAFVQPHTKNRISLEFSIMIHPDSEDQDENGMIYYELEVI